MAPGTSESVRDRVVELRRVPAAELRANPKNWRRHPQGQVRALTSVLQQVGYADALLARETPEGLELIDGHLRAEITPEQEVPVLVLDVDQEEADLILATLDPLAAMAEADGEALEALLSSVAIDSEDLAEYLAGQTGNGRKEGLTDPDEVPEAPAEPTTKVGDLWVLGGHRLLCGDATDAGAWERLMDGTQAEMVWTDPPYGVGIGEKNRFLNSIARSNRVEEDLEGDTQDEAAMLAMLRGSFGEAATYCAAGGAWYVAAPPGPLHLLTGQALNELGIWHQTIQWVKNNATFSPMGVDYHWQAEPIFYGWMPNGGHRYYGGRKQTTVWEIDRPAKSPEHPAMKPVPLVARAIENSSQGGEVVVDPFLGSGSTMIAAEQTGRRCYGMDIDPHYCDVAVRRWENFTGKTAELAT